MKLLIVAITSLTLFVSCAHSGHHGGCKCSDKQSSAACTECGDKKDKPGGCTDCASK